MRHVGVLEAKTGFSALVADVERTGEEVVVTRHGKAAVRIVPAVERPRLSPGERAELVRKIIADRERQPFVPGFDDLSWEDMKRIARGEDRYDSRFGRDVMADSGPGDPEVGCLPGEPSGIVIFGA